MTFETNQLIFGAGLGCFILEPGAAIRVLPESQLNYGFQGAGMLALRPGSRVELGQGATLVIDNHVQLQHHAVWGPTSSAVDLQPGSRLVFGPSALLTSGWNKKEAYLDLYMNGGSVAIGSLDAEARAHLRYIYPEKARPQVQGLVAYPNPITDPLAGKLAVPTRLVGRPGTVVVLDGAGRQVLRREVEALPEQRGVALPVNSPAGIYFVRLRSGEEVGSARLVLLRRADQ